MGYLFAFLFTYCCILSWIWAVKPRYIDYPRFIHKVMSRVHWPIPWENVNIRVTVYSNIVKIRTWCNQDHLTSSFRKSEIKIRLSINMYLGQAAFCRKIIFRTFFPPIYDRTKTLVIYQEQSNCECTEKTHICSSCSVIWIETASISTELIKTLRIKMT